MPVSPLLQGFVDEELAGTPLLIEEARAAAAEQLLHAVPGGSFASSELRHDAAQALRVHGARFDAQYVQALGALVTTELAALATPSPRSTESALPDSLSLMDEARVESDIEVSRAAMLIDSAVEWEHRELQTFTSALRGETHVGSDSNPIRPVLVARALWQATDALAIAPAPRVLALRALAASIGGPLKRAYAAACSRIEAQGIEPSAYRTVLFPTGSVADPGSAEVRGAAPLPAGALQELLARMSAGGGAPATRPDAEDALYRLDRLARRDRLDAPPVAARPSSLPPAPSAAAPAPQGVDPRLIELLSRLFEAILADPALPAPARGPLARLQASVLRVALREPTLLGTTDHPTWRLLDRIAGACQQAAAAGPTRLAALALACDGLADELARQAAPDGALYRNALTRLDLLLAEDLRRAQHEVRGAIAALQRTERRMRVQAQVQARLEEQFVRCPVGPATRRFLLGGSAQVLAETILQTGADGEATAALTRTVDDLLWSLHPPPHPASRQRLVKMLPGLLGRLRAHMARCGLASGEQQALLDELEASHTASLWPRTGPGGAAPEAKESPEDIVRRLREEVVAEAPPRRDFGDSVLDLSTLDTVPASLMPEPGAPGPSDPQAERARRSAAAVAALTPGRAARLLLQGHWLDAQLLWRAEGGELLLFADGAGCTHALTRRALERLHAESLALLDPPGALIQRAVDRLLASLAAG